MPEISAGHPTIQEKGMSSDLAKRLLAGESLPVDQMLESAESLVDLCIEQQEEIERLRRVEEQHERLKKAAIAYMKAWSTTEQICSYDELKAALEEPNA